MKKDWVSFRVLFAEKDTQSLITAEYFKLRFRHIGQYWRYKRLRAIGYRRACRQRHGHGIGQHNGALR
jgi:hypothetical protein